MSSRLVVPMKHLAAHSKSCQGPIHGYCSLVGSVFPSNLLPGTPSLSQKRGIILPRDSQTFKVRGWKPELHVGGSSCTCGFCKSSFSTSWTDKGSKDSASIREMEQKNKQLQEEVASLKTKLLNFDPPLLDMDDSNKSDPELEEILKNNKNWVKSQSESDPNFFKRIGGPQHPKYLYVGCSDSRVPANEILGLGPGEVFVHRNVGNQINGNDLNVLSVLEFGVVHLGVKHIIVTGHYDCGAVKAAAKKQDLGLLENWLRSIRDVHRIHQAELASIADEEAKHRRLVELNVMEQALNVYKIGCVQKKRKECATNGESTYPKIHAFVFDPKVGLLHKLPINFKKTIAQYKDVYNLY